MLGAIAGDIIGSIYEFANFKEYDFPLFSDESFFTDDSVLTVAVADALIHNLDIAKTLKAYALNYPNRGFGGSFYKWMLFRFAGAIQFLGQRISHAHFRESDFFTTMKRIS